MTLVDDIINAIVSPVWNLLVDLYNTYIKPSIDYLWNYFSQTWTSITNWTVWLWNQIQPLLTPLQSWFNDTWNKLAGIPDTVINKGKVIWNDIYTRTLGEFYSKFNEFYNKLTPLIPTVASITATFDAWIVKPVNTWIQWWLTNPASPFVVTWNKTFKPILDFFTELEKIRKTYITYLTMSEEEFRKRHA
jgi:phage-related protein